MGHAEYADSGMDIICSAVSILVINTANAIDSLTENTIVGSDVECIYWEFKDAPDTKGELLMDTMLLGLKEIQKKYGNNYLRLIIKEV